MAWSRGDRPATPGLADLYLAVEAYLGRPPEPDTAEELGHELVDLRHIQDLLELEFSRQAAKFEQLEGHDQDGSVSTIDWIRHHCRMSGSVALDRLRVGSETDQLADSVAAL